MPTCCDCGKDAPKSNFAKSQLKKSADKRRCKVCAEPLAGVAGKSEPPSNKAEDCPECGQSDDMFSCDGGCGERKCADCDMPRCCRVCDGLCCADCLGPGQMLCGACACGSAKEGREEEQGGGAEMLPPRGRDTSSIPQSESVAAARTKTPRPCTITRPTMAKSRADVQSALDFTQDEYSKELGEIIKSAGTDEKYLPLLDFDFALTAPALMAESNFLGEGHARGGWRDLLKRRVHDRMEATSMNARGDQQRKEKAEGSAPPGPIDPGCESELDVSKYGFYVETDGELSDGDRTRSFFLETCEVPARSDDGDFILSLSIPDFFDEGSSRPFDYYWEPGNRECPPPGKDCDVRAYSSYCEGIRHYPYRPCPLRIYAVDKGTGLQADFFDTSFGRIWTYSSFSAYDDEAILPMVIRAEVKKEKGAASFFKTGRNDNSRILHIYNECEGLELHSKKGFCETMGIALFRWGADLRIYIKVEFSVTGAGDFFGEKLKFR